jgi:hypothetical protein
MSASNKMLAMLDLVLDEACRSLPYGGDHELRRKIAQKLLDSVVAGNIKFDRLTEVARGALAEDADHPAADPGATHDIHEGRMVPMPRTG